MCAEVIHPKDEVCYMLYAIVQLFQKVFRLVSRNYLVCYQQNANIVIKILFILQSILQLKIWF